MCGLGDESLIQVILIPLPSAQAVHPQVTSKIPLFNELIVQRYEVHYHHNVWQGLVAILILRRFIANPTLCIVGSDKATASKYLV